MSERDRMQDADAPLPGGAPPGGLDAAEPAGEGDPANEREQEQAVERPDALEATPEHAVEPAPDPRPRAAEPPAGGDGDAGPAEPPAAGNGDAGPAEPEDPLARAERERDEYLALAQRTQADFENYRKRAAREAAAAGDRAKAGLVRELLSVVDNLERALAAAERGEGNLQEGLKLVHGSLVGVLAREGIEAFDPGGEPFDPTLHEALSTRQQDGAEPGVVLDVVEKGYRMNDGVLRPARVVVAG